MRKCLACNAVYTSLIPVCLNCTWAPDKINNFTAYSHALAMENDSFKASHFETLAQLEANNFWFQARNKLIIWALSEYCPDFESFLEIGCGTGFVLSGIAEKFPGKQFSGSELLVEGLSFAVARQVNPMEFMQMDARQIPFSREFDCIGAFDVLEHIKEDSEVLLQINEALKPKGLLLLTVPQHQWLWSQADVRACHVRRYDSKSLHKKLEQANFEIIRSTSFVFSLLPFMLISRILQKKSQSKDPYKELNLPATINFSFKKILNTEIRLIRKGINFPIGGSRLVIARSKSM